MNNEEIRAEVTKANDARIIGVRSVHYAGRRQGLAVFFYYRKGARLGNQNFFSMSENDVTAQKIIDNVEKLERRKGRPDESW